jgi:hypothetical protein
MSGPNFGAGSNPQRARAIGGGAKGDPGRSYGAIRHFRSRSRSPRCLTVVRGGALLLIHTRQPAPHHDAVVR